jgi:protein-disulfide isomerase
MGDEKPRCGEDLRAGQRAAVRALVRRWWLSGAIVAVAAVALWVAIAGPAAVHRSGTGEQAAGQSGVWREPQARSLDRPPPAAAVEEQQAAPLGRVAAAEPDVPWRGARQPRVRLVLFSDYECPVCLVFHGVVVQAAARYPDEVRLEMRQDPLPSHRQAALAAEAALAASGQGRFWEMHDQLLRQDRGLDRAALEEYARRAGLQLVRFLAALDQHELRPAVDRDVRLAVDLRIASVPTLLVVAADGDAGERLAGARGLDEVVAAIERALGGKR